MKPPHLLVPVLGLALGFLSPWSQPDIVKVRHARQHGRPAPQANPWGTWGDARVLDQRMEEACEWAKVATGTAFVQKPTAVASDVRTVAEFLRDDFGTAFRKMGAQDDAAVAAMADAAAAQVVAAYDPATHTVHVLPAIAQASAKALGRAGMLDENLLRLLLVRMAVIALDRQLVPEWKQALDGAESLDALGVAGAVLQGHAQHIAQRVASQWTKDSGYPQGGFDDLVALLVNTPAGDAPAARALHAEIWFAVVKGHEFMALASRKRKPGLANLLKQPPTDRGAILDPVGYFDKLSGKVSASNMPGQVRESFQKALWSDEGWTFEEVDLSAADAEALLAPLEKMMYSTVMAGFQGGKQIHAVKDGVENRITVVEFRAPGLAEAFVNLRKGAVERANGTTQAGAGRDGGLAGFSGSVGDDDAKRWMQWTHEGSYALGFLTRTDISDLDAREPWDDALEAAAEIVGKAEKTRTNRRDKK